MYIEPGLQILLLPNKERMAFSMCSVIGLYGLFGYNVNGYIYDDTLWTLHRSDC